ncbi:hypothetical protein DFH27DRAFT_566998 [Peziza echinospora]|nr:hypothetical protein DFH27DRAFT_566998 [Peziza echinospora]
MKSDYPKTMDESSETIELTRNVRMMAVGRAPPVESQSFGKKASDYGKFDRRPIDQHRNFREHKEETFSPRKANDQEVEDYDGVGIKLEGQTQGMHDWEHVEKSGCMFPTIGEEFPIKPTSDSAMEDISQLEGPNRGLKSNPSLNRPPYANSRSPASPTCRLCFSKFRTFEKMWDHIHAKGHRLTKARYTPYAPRKGNRGLCHSYVSRRERVFQDDRGGKVYVSSIMMRETEEREQGILHREKEAERYKAKLAARARCKELRHVEEVIFGRSLMPVMDKDEDQRKPVHSE